MKKITLLTIAFVCIASLAFAQYEPNGYIGIFSDQFGTSCELVQAGGGLYYVYIVIMQNTSGATGTWYRVERSAGFYGSYLFHTALGPWPSIIGDEENGTSIGFDQCYNMSPLAVMMVGYMMTAASEPCASLSVVEYSQQIPTKGITDCSDPYPIEVPVPGSTLYVNPDGTCECGPEPLVPNEQKTWGKIKALYE